MAKDKTDQIYGKGKDLDGWGRDKAHDRYTGDKENSKPHKELVKERSK